LAGLGARAKLGRLHGRYLPRVRAARRGGDHRNCRRFPPLKPASGQRDENLFGNKSAQLTLSFQNTYPRRTFRRQKRKAKTLTLITKAIGLMQGSRNFNHTTGAGVVHLCIAQPI
jgi:hypothetical protein